MGGNENEGVAELCLGLGAHKFLAGPVGGWVVWLGFIGWDDEASENEAFSDFVMESERY